MDKLIRGARVLGQSVEGPEVAVVLGATEAQVQALRLCEMKIAARLQHRD